MLLDDALAGLELVRRFDGPIVDVGSGGGTPGIPLAAALPEREVTLLEAERRKTEFLQRWTDELPNLRVVWGRAEEPSQQTVTGSRWRRRSRRRRSQPSGACRWSRREAPSFSGSARRRTWTLSAASHGGSPASSRSRRPASLVLRKTGPTPPGFPRRPGIAKKRPLA